MTIMTFKVSDELFQGYEVVLDLDYYDSNEQICAQIVQTLKTHLELHKFEILLGKLHDKSFHIHDDEFGDILLMSQDSIVWVCSHCKSD